MIVKGRLNTESVIANINEGKDSESVLSLNDEIFSKLAKGINKNNTVNNQVISEENLYRTFSRAIQDVSEKTSTFIEPLNNKVIAKEVLKEQLSQNCRFSPVIL